MAMGSGGDGPYNSEINVTPLVDVMLVLLVVFMITAPMLQTGVDLDLPETLTQQIEDPEGKLTLSIDLQRRLSIDGSPVKWTELKDKLATNEKLKKERELFIAADKDLPYAVVITAMAAAQQAGVVKIQMLTDSSQELDLAKLDEQEAAAGPAPR
jgi:biopolymer transport protein TolR